MLRSSLRRLLAHPAYLVTAVLTIAVGVGVNLAVFGVTRQVLVRSLPFADPDRLVVLGHVTGRGAGELGTFSAPDVDDVRGIGGPFAQLASYHFVPGLSTLGVAAPAGPIALETAYVDGAFFDTLGARPFLGRMLTESDDRVGVNRVVVLGHRAWREWFASDPTVLERDTVVNGVPFRIVGVLGPGFGFPSHDVEAWAPVTLITNDMIPHVRPVRWRSMIGRLAPGATHEQARAALDTVLGQLASTYPASHEEYAHGTVTALPDRVLGHVRGPLWWIVAAAICVFIVACANLAGLTLVRTASRMQEFAIRRALGAGRARIFGELLTEAAIIGAAGALASSIALLGLGDVLRRSLADVLPQAAAFEIDGSLWLAGLALAAVAAATMAFVPVRHVTRSSAREALGAAGATGMASVAVGSRTRRGLIVLQTAAAVVLLCAAGLIVTSVQRLLAIDWGLAPASVVALSVRPPEAVYPGNAQYTQLHRAILDRLRQLPGVSAVGAGKAMPHMDGGEPYEFTVTAPDGQERRVVPASGAQIVMDGYFESLGIPLLAGRTFTADDIAQRTANVVISASLARRIFATHDVVGQTMRLGTRERGAEFRVVGVVDDVRHAGRLGEAGETAYVSTGFFRRRTMKFFVRSSRPAADVMRAVTEVVRRIDPQLPVSDLAPLDDALAVDVARPALAARLVGAFSLVTLGLSALGLYGTLAYSALARRRELGVRLALGATPRSLLGQVVGEGLRLGGLGTLLGFLVASAAMQALRSVLYGIGAIEPLVWATAVGLTLIAALVASLVPAWRAATLDPLTALRSE